MVGRQHRWHTAVLDQRTLGFYTLLMNVNTVYEILITRHELFGFFRR